MPALSKAISLQKVGWPAASGNTFYFTVARLDEIHPVVSGNKLFKLHYNLHKAVSEKKKGILTMGGAYSNHLAATAFACRESNLASIGIVRGEVAHPLNHTLSFCQFNGMKLIAVERNEFHRNSQSIRQLLEQYRDYYFIPEGGNNTEGEKGCSEILQSLPNANEFTHIVCAVGTGTTCRGLALSATHTQKIVAVPVLRINKNEQAQFVENHLRVNSAAEIDVFFEYAEKGYAKKDDELIAFMNRFYTETNIPADFVYTAKLMKAVIHLFEKNYFDSNCNVLVIHSGGLQGNASLPPGTLLY